MIPGLPANHRKGILAAFVRELQSAAAFRNKRIVKTWRLWDQQHPTAAFTTDQMPAVQIRYLAGPVERIASTRRIGGAATSDSRGRPTIAVEVWTAGTDQNDALNLGDAIYDVLFPQDEAIRKALQTRFAEAGIRDWELAQEIAPPNLEAYGDAAVYSAGSIVLTTQFAS